MSSTHFFTFFLVFAVLESVSGATCKNSNTTTCVATTYTSATCDGTTKVCACIGATVAIPTGCGTKLSAPTLSQPAGYSTVVLDGKTATLTCTSTEGANLFEWFLNDVSLTTTTINTYTTGAITATANLGPYKCKAKVSGISTLDSVLSNGITFTILAKTDTTLTTLPTVNVPTLTSFVGKSVPISCTNVPIGYDTTKVAITDSSDNAVQPNVTITTTNKAAPVKCVLNDFPTSHANKLTGTPTNLPSIVADVTSPIISTTATNNDIYNKDATVTLKCETTPNTVYVDTSIITWGWLRDATPISQATTQTYVLPVEDGTYNIKCQVTTTTTTTPMLSDPITIKRDNALLTKQSIVANPTTPVLYSRLTLACGSSAVDGASYSWKKDSTDIARQFDRIIQIDNVTTSENGAYACTVTKSKVVLTSDAFTVNVSAAGQEMVKVSMLVLGLTLLMSKVFA